MEILNDLTKCDFYYYLVSSNNAYLIFQFLQLDNDNICIEDALVRRQKIIVDNKIIRYYNTNLKEQYNIINNLKLNKNINLQQKLIEYSKLGYLLVVQYLVSKGANIHAGNDQALQLAAQNGHLPVVQYLVSIGANIHAGNDYALRWAARNGHLPVVQYLVSIGANIHAEDLALQSALRLASENGHLEVVQYLVSIGANIHAVDDQALRWAAENGHLEVVQYLLNNGADPDV